MLGMRWRAEMSVGGRFMMGKIVFFFFFIIAGKM